MDLTFRRMRRAWAGTLVAAVLLAVASAAPAAAATFPADPTSLGPIPDGTAASCPSPGAPREVTFTVSGLPPGPPSAVSVEMSFGPSPHAWGGDIVAALISPGGVSHTLFGRTGATTSTATECGDDSDLTGPYTFTDAATSPPNGGWWQAATAAGDSAAVPSGTYRTTNVGGIGAANPMPPTSMLAAFAGEPDVNGTWTLRVTDTAIDDAAGISAASLTLDATMPPVQPPEDKTAPETTIDKGPKKKTTKAKAKFGFTSSEAASTFECQLDRRPSAPCTSPLKAKGLKPGKHKFLVHATDAAGNADATPAKWKFKVVAAP